MPREFINFKIIKNTFLLVTHSQDHYCIDLVIEHLQRQGYIAVRLNTDHFPAKYKLKWHFGNNKTGFSISIGKKIIDSDQIAAVWIRKVLFASPDDSVDSGYRSIVLNENNEISSSFLHCLSQWPALDPFSNIERAENKTMQQDYAVQCGLQIPSSIITNSAKEATAFMCDKSKRYITKLLRPVSWSMQGGEDFFYTSFITKKDIAAPYFAVHPILIQEFIPKQYELRVAYVCNDFFTGKLMVEEYEADWRRPGKVSSWHEYTLPAPVCKKLHRLMKKLGLSFGAIDMIRGSDGKYYFLEVNPIGEWGMLEKYLGLPISAAIARHLIKICRNE